MAYGQKVPGCDPLNWYHTNIWPVAQTMALCVACTKVIFYKINTILYKIHE